MATPVPSMRAGLLAASLAIVAPAQSAEPIEEIIVSAQKRTQPAQDVGISISAFTAETIRRLRLFGSEDVAGQTPGLQASSFSGDPTVMLFAIRGVGQNDFTDHHEGPTAVYVDEAYVSALGAVGFQLFDIERIEVLRGPQGTLFGRNATGGLVHYLTRKPTDALDAYVDVSVGDFSLARIEAAVGGPLGEKSRGRISVLSHTADGYLENRLGPDIHEIDQQAARLQLAFDVTPDLEALLKLTAATDNGPSVGAFQQYASVPGTDGLGEYLPGDVNADFFGLGSCPGCDPLGYRDDDNDVHAGAYDQSGRFDRDAVGGTLTISYTAGEFEFTSLTDVLDLEKSYGEDSDGSPNPLAYFETVQDTTQISQELRVTRIGDPLTWTAGLYFLDIDGDYGNVFGSPVFDADQLNSYTLETRSFAAFGQLEYDFGDRWRVVAGFRWTEDDRDFAYDPVCVGSGCVGFFVFPGSGVVSDIGGFNSSTVGSLASSSDGNWAGKLQLERAGDNGRLYAGITRGHKAGGYNAPLDGLLFPEEMRYDDEILTNYEVGFKTAWRDQSVLLNGSAFYYDYDDKQAFTFSGFTTYLLNRPAEAYGLELEMMAALDDSLDVVLGVALLEATVDDIPLPSGRIAEQDMSQAPELTLNAMVRKTWQVGDGRLGLQLQGSYVDEQYYNTINHPTALADSYTRLDASIDYAGADDRWNLTLYVNNLTDEEIATYAIDVSAFGYSLLSFAPPRWAGLQFNYRWR